MRSALLPAAALACLALGPGTAGAVTLTEYDVLIEGSGTWHRHDSKGAGSYERQAAFRWRTAAAGLVFVGKELREMSPQKVSSGTAEARDDVVIPTPTGTFAGFCSGGPAVVRAGELVESDLPALGDRTAIDMRVLKGIEIGLRECAGDRVVSPTTLVLDNGAHEVGYGPFDKTVELPHEAIGMGKVVELLERTVTGERCPNQTNATVSCTLTWKATVTFTRTRQQELTPPPSPPSPAPAPPVAGDDLVMPLGPPAPALEPKPVPQPRTAEAGSEPLLPLAGRLTGRAATVTIACPAGCSGVATASARGTTLARTRFVAKAGRPARVTLRFGARARRVLRRGTRVKVTATLTGGRKAVLTLRA